MSAVQFEYNIRYLISKERLGQRNRNTQDEKGESTCDGRSPHRPTRDKHTHAGGNETRNIYRQRRIINLNLRNNTIEYCTKREAKKEQETGVQELAPAKSSQRDKVVDNVTGHHSGGMKRHC